MNDIFSEEFKNSLDNALNLFNNQHWYEAHDVLEDIWNELDGDERQIIQGILQVSVSQFHLNKGNKNGAMILLGEGLGRIKNRTNTSIGLDLSAFCHRVNSLLNKLHNDLPISKDDIPYLVKI